MAPAAVGRSRRLQKKAFDTAEHSSVWTALRERGVEEPRIQLLTQVYDQQRASVHTDVKSKHFHLERGTMQGDPLSTLVLKSLLQHITKPVAGKWKRCDHGARLAEHDPKANLSNLRRADDILLISGSLKHTTAMPDDLTTATTARGLQLHLQQINARKARRKTKYFGPLHHVQKRRASRD